MRTSVLHQFPVQRVGTLNIQPEVFHLTQLDLTVRRLGADAIVVEDGPTNGAVTYVLSRAVADLPGGRLIVIGASPELQQQYADNPQVEFKEVGWLPDFPPSLWFVGQTDVHGSVEVANLVSSRLIVLYDVRTTERYQIKQFAANARAAAWLRNLTDRTHAESSRAQAMQQCRRGMLVSELKVWPPTTKPVQPLGLPLKTQVEELLSAPPVKDYYVPPLEQLIEKVEPAKLDPEAVEQIQKAYRQALTAEEPSTPEDQPAEEERPDVDAESVVEAPKLKGKRLAQFKRQQRLEKKEASA